MIPTHIIFHTAAADTRVVGDYGAEKIDQWHRDRGFNGIGYHFVIRTDGVVERGRNQTEQGAHCRDMGMNRKSLGITFVGHHNLQDWTGLQIGTWLELATALCMKWRIPVKNVWGHRETGARKDCPGTRIFPDAVREDLLEYLTLPTVRHYDLGDGPRLEVVSFDIVAMPPDLPMEPLPGRPPTPLEVAGVAKGPGAAKLPQHTPGIPLKTIAAP